MRKTDPVTHETVSKKPLKWLVTHKHVWVKAIAMGIGAPVSFTIFLLKYHKNYDLPHIFKTILQVWQIT